MNKRSEHLQCWIESGQAISLSLSVTLEFEKFLESLPWSESGFGLDWEHLGATSIDLSEATDEEIKIWLKATCFSKDDALVFWFGPNEICLACSPDFAISNIDQAYWKTPGKGYLFGGRVKDGAVRPVFEHFAEYDGGDRLVAKLGTRAKS